MGHPLAPVQFMNPLYNVFVPLFCSVAGLLFGLAATLHLAGPAAHARGRERSGLQRGDSVAASGGMLMVWF